MNKILWIGSINWINNDGSYVISPNTAGAVSSSSFEQAIIEGIETCSDNVIQVLTDMDNECGKRFVWSHNAISQDVCVSGISLKYIRLVYKSLMLRQEIKKNKGTYENFDYAIIYSIHVPYVSTYKLLKHLNNNMKIILICPDLCEYSDPAIHRKPIKAFLRKIERKYIESKSKLVDGYVLFSEKMKSFFSPNIKYTVLEGVFSDRGIDLSSKQQRENYIMYAGSLSSNFGLQNLIEAFKMMLDVDINLYIFGTGELSSYIQEQAKVFPRIKYFGFVDRKTLFEYEKKAFLLINTRDPNEPFTKYSFPSKTFEYMVSGTPFLTTKLEGIPAEYYNYLITIDDNSPSSILAAIKDYLKWTSSEIDLFGMQAKNYVLRNKNKNAQAKKMLDFIGEL